jgi:hypothetical protein
LQLEFTLARNEHSVDRVSAKRKTSVSFGKTALAEDESLNSARTLRNAVSKGRLLGEKVTTPTWSC